MESELTESTLGMVEAAKPEDSNQEMISKFPKFTRHEIEGWLRGYAEKFGVRTVKGECLMLLTLNHIVYGDDSPSGMYALVEKHPTFIKGCEVLRRKVSLDTWRDNRDTLNRAAREALPKILKEGEPLDEHKANLKIVEMAMKAGNAPELNREIRILAGEEAAAGSEEAKNPIHLHYHTGAATPGDENVVDVEARSVFIPKFVEKKDA